MDENSRTRTIQMRFAWMVIGLSYIIVWIAPFLTDLSGQAQSNVGDVHQYIN